MKEKRKESAIPPEELERAKDSFRGILIRIAILKIFFYLFSRNFHRVTEI